MRENLKRDRARTTVTRISEFGLLEMTRQRMRPSLRKSYFSTCPTCAGRGEMKSPETIAAEVTRQVGFTLDHPSVARIELVCSPRVASVLLSRKRRELVHLEDRNGKRVDVRVSDDIPVDRVDYYAYDERNADIELERLPQARTPDLEDLASDPEETETALAAAGGGGGSRRRRRRRGPADATAIAVSGAFLEGLDLGDDEEDEDAGEVQRSAAADEAAAEEPSADGGDAERSEKRRRRRRRRRRGAGEAGADGQDDLRQEALPAALESEAATEAEAEPARVFDEETRVHLVAKHLGISSRDIVERCSDDENFEVRGPMSRLSIEQANTVVGWYTPPSADGTPQERAQSEEGDHDRADAEGRTDDADHGDDAGPKRKRRRRGGRRHRRGREEREHHGEGDAVPPVEVSRDQEPEDAGESAASGEGNSAPKRKRRRKRSGAAAEGAVAGDVPAPKVSGPPAAEVNGAVKKAPRKRRSRSRRGSERAADAPVNARATTGKTSPPEAVKEPKGAPSESAKPETAAAVTTVRKRSLYRNRRAVSAAARSAAEAGSE